MAETKKLFDMASLAEAAYAIFTDLQGKLEVFTREDLITRLQDFDADPRTGTKGFSKTQAEEFAKHYRVVHQQPNTASGFSATVFERLSESGAPTGELIFATRGTETGVQLAVDAPLGLDLAADIGDLVADGLAWGQIVDMYNYWKQLTTPAGTGYQKAVLVDVTDQSPAGGTYILGARVSEASFSTSNYKWQIQLVTATDGISNTLSANLNSASVVQTTGHSLGGHLSFAFSRLFPGNTSLTISRSDSADRIYVRGFGRSRSAQRFQSTRRAKAVTHLWRHQTRRNTQKTTHVPCAFPSKSGWRGAWNVREGFAKTQQVEGVTA